MQVELIRSQALGEERLGEWIALQRSNPHLDSPYFCPEFTQAVASVRDDVEIAVLRDAGETIGFFPFQRTTRSVGKPVGGRLADFQGVIAGPDAAWNAHELIDACGLSAWSFDHLLASQAAFEPDSWGTAVSPYIDLSNGFEEFRKAKRKAGGRELDQALRKSRKLSREVGPLRFEADLDDDQVFDTLLHWKSEQYQRTRLADVFAFDWTVALLQQLRTTRTDDFQGLLSGVYAGDRLVAVHFGIRSGAVLHYWFPAYDREFMKYSPGLVLLAEICQAVEDLGIRRVDLGKGTEQYKTSFMTGTTLLAEGAVENRLVSKLVRKGWHDVRAWVRSSRLSGPAQVPAAWIRPLREWIAFR